MTGYRKYLGVAGVLAVMLVQPAWSKELAKVNGKPITSKDLEQALGSFNEGQRENILADTASRRHILLSLIDEELLAQKAEKDKLDQDQEYKDAAAMFRKHYLANRALQKDLTSKVTDKAAKKFYENNKARFSTDEVHAQHILVTTEAEAKEILKKAKEPNADFMKLAEENSKDPSAKNNRGDLGFFTRDAMVGPFTDAAFGASAGEIVGPVKTSYGYHIIKVVEKKLGKPLEFTEVELKVKDQLRQELTQEYVGKLKDEAKVSIDEKALEKK